MPYGVKLKKPKAFKAAAAHIEKKRHGTGAAKKLKSAANVTAHSATHIKSRMKRY
jgi:hypothetical protein